MHAPFSANIFLTHYCNLSCSFCCYRPFQGGGNRDLDTCGWMTIIDKLAELKVFQIKILAGEPLLRRDIKDILQHIADRKMRFFLNSNGTLLNEDFAGFLAGLQRCDGVQISIDGMEQEHDAIRGRGNWHKAVNAVKILKKFSIPVTVNMVLTGGNFRKSIAAVDRLQQLLEPDVFRISSVSDSFNEVDAEHGVLSDEQYVQMMLAVLRLKERYRNIRSNFLVMHKEITRPEISDGNTFCTIPEQSICIAANGDVIACPNAVNHVAGNSLAVPLQELWRSDCMENFRREVKCGSLLPAECDGCRYRFYCKRCCPPSANPVQFRCRKRLAEILEKLT